MNNSGSPVSEYKSKLYLYTWKPFYVTAVLILLAFTNYGQVTAGIGTGAATATNIPICANYSYSYSQQIYTAADMNAAGGIATNIQKLRFYLNSANFPVNNSSNWTIYMGNSPHSAFTSDTDWEPLSNLTEVYSGDITYPESGNNWVSITLSGAFTWDGVSNIIVAVLESAPGYDADVHWNATDMGSGNQRSIYYRNDINNPDPAAPPTATGRSAYVPDIQFDFTQIPCAGLTPNPDSTIASQERLCGSNTLIMLNLKNDYSNYSGISYQWQYSQNGVSGWEDIDSATDLSFTITPSNTAFYRALLSCATNEATSIPVKVTVNPLPPVALNADTFVYCDGANVSLMASGAASYTWSPATGLNIDTGSSVTASPAFATLYTLTGTDTSGCQNTAKVKVIPISAYLPQTTMPVVNICEGVAAGSLSVVTLTDNNSNALAYELKDTGGNVIVPWQTNDLFEFTPSEAGDFLYCLSARLPGCAVVSDTSEIHIYQGFSADVNIITPDCSAGNDSIIITNARGAAVAAKVWQNDFSSTSLPLSATLYGNATITGGRAVLTPSATSNKGALSITNIDTVSPQELEINFDFTADQPINNFGTGGGDGLAWSFGDDADYTPSVTNGAGSKLRVVFDAANNGLQNGNTRGIYLTYGYTDNAQMGPASAGVLAYSTDISWKFQTDKPVQIIIDREGKLTLKYDDTIIFNQVQLPSDYINADKSQWKHLFTAFTGGDALRHAIANLNITYRYYNFVYGLSPGGTGNIPAAWQQSTSFTNLATPDSFDVWIAAGDHPESCNKLLGTYRFTHPITVSNTTYSELTSCNSNDGTITLAGLVPGLIYDVSYLQNNTTDSSLTIITDNAGNIILNNLPPGLYSNISVTIDGCTNDSISDISIPEPVKPDIIAFPSGSNTDCTNPNGSITIFSADFLNNSAYDVWYNGTQHSGLSADANHLITIPGLSSGSYDNIYVVTPQACYSDTVASQAVGGLMPAAIITGATSTNATSCNTTDGAVLLSGNFNTGTSYITFKRNGIPDVMVAYPALTQTGLGSLSPGTYDSIRISGTNTCPSNIWGAAIVADNVTTDAIATGNTTATDLQGAGVAVHYTNSNCELIATINSVNDSLGNVTAAVYITGNTPLYNNEPFIGRYYDIEATNNAGGSVTLYFTDNEIDDYNTTVTINGNSSFPPIGPNGENLEIIAYHSPAAGNGPQGYDTNGAEIIVPTGIVHNTSDSIWAVTFNTGSFSGFFAHSAGSGTPLAVQLINVKATNSGATNRIDWSMSETAMDYQYTIERSMDGKIFKAIGTTDAGPSGARQYSYIDANPFIGINFYRIAIRDQAGKIFYSEIVSAVVKEGRSRISVYPNPVRDELTVKISGAVKGQGRLWLTDALGHIIDDSFIYNKGTVRIDMQAVAPGLYILKYQDADGVQSIKVDKQ